MEFRRNEDGETYIPFYIVNDIVEYIEYKGGISDKIKRWSNISTLINGAVLNHRLTREEATKIKEKFCRED